MTRESLWNIELNVTTSFAPSTPSYRSKSVRTSATIPGSLISIPFSLKRFGKLV